MEQVDGLIKGRVGQRSGSGHQSVGDPKEDVGDPVSKIFDRELLGAVGIANAEAV